MNYVILTVKVIKNSGQSFFKDGTPLTELVVQLPQISKNYPNLILNLSIWGKLSYDVATYYKPNDYLIIEGYILIKNLNLGSLKTLNLIDKQVEISVFKLYPLLF
jgi:hypothetical protein|uniref:Single-stranded DNA binding protein n=1 Tax=Cyclotella sp. L04_2 TaxID=1549163 RepID=A0A089VGS0_9STRA|nr:hypothetical protein Ycf41 [Cyclotella sp. L04_2]